MEKVSSETEHWHMKLIFDDNDFVVNSFRDYSSYPRMPDDAFFGKAN
jgi:hypothetical protein